MASQIEVRAAVSAAVDEKRTVSGYAIRCDEETTIGSLFRERISVGAVRGADLTDVRALYGHDDGRVLGRTKSGTLRLKADAIGLKFEIDLPKSPDGDTAYELVRRGDISGMSFGFRPTSESWLKEGKLPLRIINSMELMEISLVAFPAYPTTSVGLRNLAAHRAEISNAARVARMKIRMEQSLRRARC